MKGEEWTREMEGEGREVHEGDGRSGRGRWRVKGEKWTRETGCDEEAGDELIPTLPVVVTFQARV